MAKIWKKRIVAGDQVFSSCPMRYKEEVITLLEQDVENRLLSQEQFEELISK